MSERDVAHTEPPVTDAPHDDAPHGDAPHDDAGVPALLTRLNRRGFRLLMLADGLVLSAVTLGVMFYRFGTQWPTYPVSAYGLSFALAIGIFLLAFYFGGLYDREPRLGAPPALPRVARQTIAGGGLTALLVLASTGLAQSVGVATAGRLPFPIINLAAVIVLGALGVAANRALAMRLRTRREGPPKVLLVGDDAEVATARRHLATDASAAEVVAATDDPERIDALLAQTDATDVVLLSGRWLAALYPQRLESLEHRHVTVLLRVSALETMYGLERIREVAGMPFVLVRAQTLPRSRIRFKRLFDLCILLALAPFALAVLALVALYQLIVAGRPLLYRQERVGAQGRLFRMVKFRTMAPDAEADGQARLAEEDDPRVIPACRWIRATRLDELPQLWNVLRGEMSVVGPRPERPELTSAFEQGIVGYSRRHELPPGLTGLAQIHGRYHTDAEYKLGYDLQYLVNWSPVLDLEILARTVWVVLTRRI